ncbi:MAG: YiiX/YebB-like N1pC/P60 family cysteine hydrolase, partial [Candidatus Rokuibacteriota bacterium]
RVETVVERARERLAAGVRPGPHEADAYEALVLYALYDRYQADFYRLVTDPLAAPRRVGFFERFGADLVRYAGEANSGKPPAHTGHRSLAPAEAAHLFACFFQVRRAFHHIFANILGASAPVKRLRAAVWQSIFTHDHGRYRRALYARMSDIPTLVTGPSGTGTSSAPPSSPRSVSSRPRTTGARPPPPGDRRRPRGPLAHGPRSHLEPEQGRPRRVLEAISEGVGFGSLERLAADSLAVLRPRLPAVERAMALVRAFGYAGRPYDFEFDFWTDAALVCTEVVYKAYEPSPGTRGLRWAVPEILGRPVLPPNELARQFDTTAGTPDQQLDLVLFLDGQERTGTAVERGLDAFRQSWRRPKWQLLTQP